MTAPDPAKVLLVTLMDPDAPPGGRELVSPQCPRAGQPVGDTLTIHRLIRNPDPGLAEALSGQLNGLTPQEIARIVTLVGDLSAGQVFVNGSTLGHIVAPIKRAHPNVRVVTFFYNVEARFFLGAARPKRTALSLALLAASWAAERDAVRHSDAIVCLSARDADGLRRLYGRGADHISPIALADALPSPRPAAGPGERYLIFVGGAVYANRRGNAGTAGDWPEREAPPIAVRSTGFWPAWGRCGRSFTSGAHAR